MYLYGLILCTCGFFSDLTDSNLPELTIAIEKK